MDQKFQRSGRTPSLGFFLKVAKLGLCPWAGQQCGRWTRGCVHSPGCGRGPRKGRRTGADETRGLTFVARRPGLVAVVAGDAQDPLLDGREPRGPASEVLHRARPFQVLLDRLVHHQVLELPELGTDVRQSPGTDVR